MEEIRECIAFYDARGRDWSSAVTYIGIKHLFGGWNEVRRLFLPMRRRAG